MQNVINQLGCQFFRKGAPAGGHFVEHRAHCIDIGTRVCSLALQLFGRHVGQRSHEGPGFGQAGGEA